jgi:hypothetical protein
MAAVLGVAGSRRAKEARAWFWAQAVARQVAQARSVHPEAGGLLRPASCVYALGSVPYKTSAGGVVPHPRRGPHVVS